MTHDTIPSRATIRASQSVRGVSGDDGRNVTGTVTTRHLQGKPPAPGAPTQVPWEVPPHLRPRPDRERSVVRRVFSPSMIWRICGGLLVIVLVLGAWTLSRMPGGPTGGAAKPSAPAADLKPFDGTPAASFAVGAAGLKMPAAKAIDGWTASQVKKAQALVKQALVAGHLDRRMLVQGQTSAFVALFARDNRSDVRERFLSGRFSGAAVRIAPTATLAADPPRVRGTTTIDAGADHNGLRVLEITTDYIWVYPFAGKSTSPGERLVVVHDTQRWWIYQRGEVTAASAGLWLNRSEAYAFNTDCRVDDSYIAPSPPGQRKLPPITIYNPDMPPSVPNPCG